MSTTPNMGLIEPDVGITAGPLWAQLLNALVNVIDAHDHTAGKGTKITPAGLLVNADLALNNFTLRSAKSVELVSQASNSDIGVIYRIGNNLFYNNGAGAAVQITSGSSVNAPGSGVISANVVASYPYTVLASDAQKVIIVDTSVARTLSLPPATTAMFFMVKDGPGNAQTNPISVVPNGTDTLDGSNGAYLIDANFASFGFVSDGVTKWYAV